MTRAGYNFKGRIALTVDKGYINYIGADNIERT
jgi:hypothetical protein